MISAYLLGCVSVIVMMFTIWLIYLRAKNAAIVDIGWGLGFIIMTSIFVHLGAGWTVRNQIMFALIVLWGGRVMYFILKRIRQEQVEDKRYTDFRKKWKTNIDLNFLRLFEIQAFLQMMIVLPVLFVVFNPSVDLTSLEIFSSLLCLLAIIAEAVADEQLKSFKMNPDNKGKTCQAGFWNYSRHPNYFFEILVWVFVYVYSLSSPGGWATIISPVLISYIIIKVTGIPLAEEQSIRSRGDEYRRYQETTSVLIPLPKKRALR